MGGRIEEVSGGERQKAEQQVRRVNSSLLNEAVNYVSLKFVKLKETKMLWQCRDWK